MESNVEVLLKKCTEKTEWHNYINLAWWSFWNNFEETKKNISFVGVGNSELVQFIKICDNRLARSKTFLDDVAVVFGFALLSLSIVVNMAGETTLLPYFIVVTALLFVILIILIILMIHYRSDIHAWSMDSLQRNRPDETTTQVRTLPQFWV